jgi:hypothetical protein
MCGIKISQTCNATHNQITVLLITGLRYFDATHNQITVLLIAGLRYFDATHNQITVLPSDFGNQTVI